MTEEEAKITWQDVADTFAYNTLQVLEETNDGQGLTVRQKEMILEDATMENPFKSFGDYTKRLRRLYACHIACRYITPMEGKGAISSVSIGGVTTSHTMPVNNPSAEFPNGETTYGRDYDKLKKRLSHYKRPFGPLIVN